MNPLTSEHRYDSSMATIYAFEWDYDGVGNRTYQYRDGTETYYSHNEANELRHFVEGGASTYFQYDARGNCTVIEKPSGATYFEYSDADLVTSIRFASGVTNYFHYDGKLRRYAIEDSNGLTYFTWDQNGMNLLAEFDAYGNTIAEYTHGYTPIDGIGSMVERKLTDRTDPMNPVTYYRYDSYDHRGTPFGTTDENGNRVGTFDYNAFGDRLQATEVGPTSRIGYQSNWIALPDSNGDLGLSRTRLYHAPTGRFLQEDPLAKMGPLVRSKTSTFHAMLLGDAAGRSVRKGWGLGGPPSSPAADEPTFGYSKNDPVSGLDPAGLACCGQGLAIRTYNPRTHCCWDDDLGIVRRRRGTEEECDRNYRKCIKNVLENMSDYTLGKVIGKNVLIRLALMAGAAAVVGLITGTLVGAGAAAAVAAGAALIATLLEVAATQLSRSGYVRECRRAVERCLDCVSLRDVY